MKRNCHEFIAYENLVRSTSSGHRRQPGTGGENRSDRMTIDKALPLVTRAMGVLSERDGAPPLGLLKTTLLQLDSTFDERSYGAGSFRDFAQKLEKAGVLKVTQGKGGWMVSPAEGAPTSIEAPGPSTSDENGAPAPQASRAQHAGRAPQAEPVSTGPVDVVGTPADGLREFARVLSAAEIRKWPLYLRNVKQVMRAATPPLEERAYGFANLTDLLRAAHKDNVVRMERDRQGVIRVFQANGAAAVPAAANAPSLAEMEPIVITTGPEVVDAVVVEIGDDADANDVNGNVAEPLTADGVPVKGKSRRRPQPRGGRKTVSKKKS